MPNYTNIYIDVPEIPKTTESVTYGPGLLECDAEEIAEFLESQATRNCT